MNKVTYSHPLEPIVRSAFEHQDKLDAPMLIKYLSGADVISDGGQNAYIIVARDVLGFMECQGKLHKNTEGLYLLVDVTTPTLPELQTENPAPERLIAFVTRIWERDGK